MKKYTHLLVFAGLTFLILPFVSKGYFFLLDDPFMTSVKYAWTTITDSNFGLFLLGFKALGEVIPLWGVQRIFYWLVVFFLGLGGYKLLSEKSTVGAYFAGIFLMFNPYVYARILDGQMGIIAGIVCVLWHIYFLQKYFQTRSLAHLIASAVFAGVTLLWMAHGLFFVIASTGILLGFDLVRRKQWRFTLKSVCVIIGTMFVLNAGWIVSSFVGNTQLSSTLQNISSPNNLEIFSTSAGDANIYLNTLSLHGFWGEREGRYIPTYAQNEYWKILFACIFLVILLGVYHRYKDENPLMRNTFWAFITLAVLSYILSLWIAQNNIFAGISRFLYDHVPLYIGLREPQKWSGVLMIVYAYFGGYGLMYISSHPFIRMGYPRAVTAFVLLLPVLYTPTMLFGFQGQMRVSDFPQEWYALKSDLTRTPGECAISNKSCYDMLVFPWHLYMGFGFTGRIIANPSEGFFDSVRVLQGDNIEIADLYTQSTKPASKVIEKYIGPHGQLDGTISKPLASAFTQDLKKLGIRKILLLKEVDFATYETRLTQIEKFGLVTIERDNPALKLYLIP